MSAAFRFADDLGPIKLVELYQPGSGLKAVLAIDNVAMGPAIGGARMAVDVSAEEAFRLARAMTLKNAAAGLAHGGGKAVIVADPKMAVGAKEHLIRSFARALRPLDEYIVGPDMGTDETCMAWIHDEIGRSVGLPAELGGIPLDQIGATGWGLVNSIEVAREFVDLDLAGATVAVQGFGSVGRHAARFLVERGARVVAAADSSGTLVDSAGIDVAALSTLKGQGGSVLDYSQGDKRGGDAIIDVPCDIWIPAARPDVIRADNVQRLQTRLLVQGANIPCTAEAEAFLHQHGVLVIPDFIANAGGVICAAMEYRGSTEAQAMQAIAEKITANTRVVLEQARAGGQPPRAVAEQLALTRVRKAMTLRR